MRVYFDSSALLKRAIREAESADLISALDRFANDGALLLTSTLATVEVTRGIRLRLDAAAPTKVVELVDTALSGFTERPIDEQVIGLARRLGPSSLRSLDAIHLATATLLDVDLVCAYDQRLLTSASELGFRTISP